LSGRFQLDRQKGPGSPACETDFAVPDEAIVPVSGSVYSRYDFAFVQHAPPEHQKAEVLPDAPQIPDRGSYGLLDLAIEP